MVLIDLIYNLALLVALSVVSGFVDTRWKRNTLPGALLQGVVFGGAAVIGMLRPFVFAPGLIFDGRSVMISLGGFFFGPWTAAVTCLMTIPLRIAQGGPGMVMGVLVILNSAAIGVGFHLRRHRRLGGESVAMLLIFGLLVHAAMLAMTVALPPAMIVPVLKRIGWPVMLAYPLATVLIGKILSDQAARAIFLGALQEGEQRFRAIFNSTYQFTGLLTPDGMVIEANQTFLDFAGIKMRDVVNRPFWEARWWRGNDERVRQLREAITRAARGEFIRYEVELQGAGASTAIIDFSLKPVVGRGGRVTMLIPEGRDMTERKQADERARAAQVHLSYLTKYANDLIILLDKNFRFLEMNERAVDFYGYTREELIGMHATKVRAPAVRALFDEQVKPEPETGRTVFETIHQRKDGTTFPVEVSLRAIDIDGKRFYQAIIRDITERKQAAEALRENEARLSMALEVSNAGAWQWTIESDVVSFDLRFHAMLGYLPGELPTTLEAWKAYHHPEDLPGMLARAAAYIHGESPVYESEHRLRTKAGGWIWVFTRGKLVNLTPGSPNQFIGIAMDVTERKKAQDIVRQREAYDRSLIEASLDPLVTISPEGRITDVNKATENITGYSRRDLIGTVFSDYCADHEEANRGYQMVLKAGFVRDYALEIKHRDGHLTPVLYNATLYRDEKNNVVGVFAAARDMTERKRAEEELLATQASLERRVIERTAELAVARDRAEAADRTKSAFLATMSHELRTPLNSIIGFTGILLQGLAGALNTEQIKQLRMVKESGEHLLALINDVLDISKIEAGQLEIVTASFDAPASIQKVVETVTPLAAKKHIPLLVEIAPDVHSITSDRRRFEQILLNLLSNAIKFTDQGKVMLTAEIVSSASPLTHAAVRISVTDTGPGIKPDDLGNLFQPFRQLDTGLTRQHEGTGLGLAICKRLIERLGGTIEVASDWGKGSTFRVTVPIDPERRS